MTVSDRGSRTPLLDQLCSLIDDERHPVIVAGGIRHLVARERRPRSRVDDPGTYYLDDQATGSQISARPVDNDSVGDILRRQRPGISTGWEKIPPAR